MGRINTSRGMSVAQCRSIRAATWAFGPPFGVCFTRCRLQVHLRARMSEYFFQPGDKPLFSRLRLDMFGLANDIGLAAAIIVIVLAAISNDWSLRRSVPGDGNACNSSTMFCSRS